VEAVVEGEGEEVEIWFEGVVEIGAVERAVEVGMIHP